MPPCQDSNSGTFIHVECALPGKPPIYSDVLIGNVNFLSTSCINTDRTNKAKFQSLHFEITCSVCCYANSILSCWYTPIRKNIMITWLILVWSSCCCQQQQHLCIWYLSIRSNINFSSLSNSSWFVARDHTYDSSWPFQTENTPQVSSSGDALFWVV